MENKCSCTYEFNISIRRQQGTTIIGTMVTEQLSTSWVAPVTHWFTACQVEEAHLHANTVDPAGNINNNSMNIWEHSEHFSEMGKNGDLKSAQWEHPGIVQELSQV